MPDDLIADAGAKQSGGERRDPGYAAMLGLRLVLADNGEFTLAATRIGNANRSAEGNLVMRLRRRIDEIARSIRVSR